MNDRLRPLIEAARSGRGDALDALVRALRAPPAAVELMLELAAAEASPLRCAVIRAGWDRPEPPVVNAIIALSLDAANDVRLTFVREVRAALESPSCAARAAYEARLCDVVRHDRLEEVRLAAAEALACAAMRRSIAILLSALAQDEYQSVSQACARSAEQLLARIGTTIDGDLPSRKQLDEAMNRLEAMGVDDHPRLAALIREQLEHEVDIDQLRELGTDLTASAEEGHLPRAFEVDGPCEAVLRAVTARQSTVLLGPSGVGKTAIVCEVVHRLRQRGGESWRVLRVSPSDLLAGTRYLGEWQTKVQKLVSAVRAPRRVLLYVPNLAELSQAGKAAESDTNVATMLAPYLESGTVTVLGEATPEAFRSGLGTIGSLRRLFAAIDVREPGEAATRAILRAVRNEAHAQLGDDLLDRLAELANLYLAGTAQPGRAVGLLRRTVETLADGGAALTQRDVLASLSAATGIPTDFLDDAVPLELGRVRGFFESRVMGQPEALQAVVDLVALIKAGLNDPSKPFGVLLFVGPTGVGKTELARALAELLFGDASRLGRFDMSEFSSYDAHERLIGRGGQPGLLTAAVRERPFSVLLFDEVEKAHSNVFDLFLQVFDAGRLTDAAGVTADFRHTIIVMTSNVGAAIPVEMLLGFKGGTPPPPDADAIQRELQRFFRPEFLNRLDRIVSFRPLAMETAQKIALREVTRVAERSGVTRRELTLDVDASVLALLLREGYSPAFGARPLKRTVERRVLMPLARVIAEGKAPRGSVLRLVAHGTDMQVEVVRPEGDEPITTAAPTLHPLRARVADLIARVAVLRAHAAPLSAQKSELVSSTSAPSFWDDRQAALRTLDQIHRLEEVVGQLDRLEHAVLDLADRAERSRRASRAAEPLAERLDDLTHQADHLEFLLGLREPRDLGDTIVTITLVRQSGDGLAAVQTIAGMYAGLARRRALQLEPIDDRDGGEPAQDAVSLLISGTGAHATLARETGLHELSRSRGGGRKGSEARALVRVDVLPAPADEPRFAPADLRVELRPLKGVRGRVIASPRIDLSLLHLPSMTGVRVWSAGPREQALKHAQLLLRARLDAASLPLPSAQGIARRYAFGSSPMVRDRRTGRSTARIDRVLKGELELLQG